MRSLLRLAVTTAAATAMVVGTLASVVEARDFRMTGQWIQNRGPSVDIPIFGGINANKTTISATGSAPADMTVPINAFFDTNAFAFALPQTSLVQLTTMFTHNGPNSLGVLSGGAKGTRPANFGWCIGAAANPGCTTPQTGAAQGTQHGLVTYTAGANQFGGTMRMLIEGTGEVARIVGTAPIRIQHNTLGGGGDGRQIVGAPYASTNTNLLPGGPITTGGVCAGGPCGVNGLITVPGIQDGSGQASTNTNVGFPWTTGMVSAIVTTMLPTTNSTLVLTGSDNRTDLGAGNITLVAGGLAYRNPVNRAFPSLDIITMSVRAKNLPSISLVGMAGLAGLLIVGAGFAARRRSNR